MGDGEKKDAIDYLAVSIVISVCLLTMPMFVVGGYCSSVLNQQLLSLILIATAMGPINVAVVGAHWLWLKKRGLL